MSRTEKSRIAWLDLLRIIACFLVIVNHTNSGIFLTRDPSMKTWWVSLAYFFICKAAVPIFLLITGYMMLEKEDGYEKMGKRFLRIVLVIVLFSLLYYVNNILHAEGAAFDLVGYLHLIVVTPVTNAYWYLYLYAGIVLMLPFLQKLAARMEKKDFQMFFLISILFVSVYPILLHYIPEWSLTEQFRLPLFDGYLCLLFLGCYFRRYGTFPIPVSLLAIAGGLAWNLVFTFQEYRSGAEYYLFYDDRLLLPIMLEALGIFSLVAKVKIGEKAGERISVIGQCTFGIFLLSDFFLEKWQPVYLKLCDLGVHQMISVVIWELLIFFTGFGVTFLLRLIPPVRKLI